MWHKRRRMAVPSRFVGSVQRRTNQDGDNGWTNESKATCPIGAAIGIAHQPRLSSDAVMALKNERAHWQTVTDFHHRPTKVRRQAATGTRCESGVDSRHLSTATNRVKMADPASLSCAWLMAGASSMSRSLTSTSFRAIL